MIQGIFQFRRSRRLCEVEVGGEIVEAYISNGVEISFLKPGTICYLREAFGEKRRTDYDLYSAYDGNTLACLDAKEPLRVVKNWYLERLQKEYPEERIHLYDDPRSSYLIGFDYPIKGMRVQIMGTTFIKDQMAYLPVIPSSALNERLESLLWEKDQGYDPRLMIVICRSDANCFSANAEADPYFSELLNEVYEADIPVECLRCTVDENGMKPDMLIPYKPAVL